MAMAATISATLAPGGARRRRRVEARVQRERPGRLFGEGALVALQGGAGVAVLRCAEEQSQDLRDVVLVYAEVHEAAWIPGLGRLDLRPAQRELARQRLEVGQPARAQARVATHVEHHLVQRQRLVAALDVTHRRRP